MEKQNIEPQKKRKFISKQLSSGEMTLNQARETVGLPLKEDPNYNVYIMSEKFCNNKRINP